VAGGGRDGSAARSTAVHPGDALARGVEDHVRTADGRARTKSHLLCFTRVEHGGVRRAREERSDNERRNR
jgi:hypothetical protein